MIIRSLARKAKNYLKEKLSPFNKSTSNQSLSVFDLLFQVDPTFQALYNQGIEKTGTPPIRRISVVNKREARFYNLINIYSLAAALDGNIAEIGCWKGLSAYMLNKSASQNIDRYTGKEFWIIDSFEGLSDFEDRDQILEDFVPIEIVPGSGHVAGSFSASLDHVKQSLNDYPDINYIKGWVPNVLDQIPKDLRWKFVHIDLDLYAPIKGAFKFFSERMTPGGVIVFDDYGSLPWPGARKAVDEVSAEIGGCLVLLSTGQAFWQAPFNRHSEQTQIN
jgi:hypothetical protein